MNRWLALIIIVVLFSGCKHTRPEIPKSIPAPVVAKPADVSKVTSSVTKANESVTKLELKLRSAEVEVAEARVAANSAFEKGVEAGSLDAANLKSRVLTISTILNDTREDRDELQTELKSAQVELFNVKGDLTAMEQETKSLREGLKFANAEIRKGQELAEIAAVLEHKLKRTRKMLLVSGLMAAAGVAFILLRY